jgi:non-ribosomal peptide synthetase component F
MGVDGWAEEMWMAFLNGAVPVLETKETPRSGNDLARVLSSHNVIYISAVPKMLTTDIPSLCQVIVSGEVCPPELVSWWARSGRISVRRSPHAQSIALCRPLPLSAVQVFIGQ